ncbi:hypothetical protein BaRGS_00005031, partial [Batillaria attramentaria]
RATHQVRTDLIPTPLHACWGPQGPPPLLPPPSPLRKIKAPQGKRQQVASDTSHILARRFRWER